MRQTLHKVWTLFTPPEQRKAIGMLLLIICMAVLETVGVLSITPFLSVLARPGIIQENPWLRSIYERFEFSSLSEFMSALGMVTIAIVVGTSIFKTLTFHYVGRFVHMQRQSLGVRLLSIYLHQPYEFFLTRNSSELAKNVHLEVEQVIFQLLQPLSMLIAQGAVAIAMMILVFTYDPWMATCILTTIGALYAFIYILVRKRLARIGKIRIEEDTRRYQSCNEALTGIKDVKVNHAADAYLKIYAKSSHEFSRHSATAETLSQSPLYIVEAVGYSGLIIIALILLWKTGDSTHILPTLGLYGFAAYRLLPAAQIMYRGFARLKFSSASLELLHADLNLKKEGSKISDSTFPELKKGILINNVSYAYPLLKNKNIIENINLFIPAKKTTRISGKSGSGKSTLMDIILGLLKPQSGLIQIDDVILSNENSKAWQLSVGYVPQTIYITNTTIAENIAFGISRNNIDMHAVEFAAKMAQIHDFIVSELPEKYNSTLGEQGIRLSGGQRQRIGIARALYKNPSVILFDEATSALDQETEKYLNDALFEISKEKTIIIITHNEEQPSRYHNVINI